MRPFWSLMCSIIDSFREALALAVWANTLSAARTLLEAGLLGSTMTLSSVDTAARDPLTQARSTDSRCNILV